MAQHPVSTLRRTAPVVSLADVRAARRKRARSRGFARPLVAMWFGVAIFATLLILGFAATVAMRAPAIGVPVGVAIATAAAWPSAGTWLTQRRARSAA